MKKKLLTAFLVLGMFTLTNDAFSMVPSRQFQSRFQRRNRFNPNEPTLAQKTRQRVQKIENAKCAEASLSIAKQLLKGIKHRSSCHTKTTADPSQLAEAYLLLKLAATNEDARIEVRAEAVYWAAKAKLRGWGTTQDREISQGLFELASVQPHKFQYQAKYYLAQFYLKDDTLGRAIDLLEQAAQQTNEEQAQALAKHALAQIYLYEEEFFNLQRADEYIEDIQRVPMFQSDKGKASIQSLKDLIAQLKQQPKPSSGSTTVRVKLESGGYEAGSETEE